MVAKNVIYYLQSYKTLDKSFVSFLGDEAQAWYRKIIVEFARLARRRLRGVLSCPLREDMLTVKSLSDKVSLTVGEEPANSLTKVETTVCQRIRHSAVKAQ